MPIVFEKDGFRFFFYSNDHKAHYVRKGADEAVFNVEGEVTLRESQGLKIKELSQAQELAEENKAIIIEKWHEHLADTARTAEFVDGEIVVRMESGVEIAFPLLVTLGWRRVLLGN